MDIITLAQKRNMTYDFYLKHNMSATSTNIRGTITGAITCMIT